ncbi:LysM peptidoglycan-binding domain-containing protein [Candidatus Venteria ishoeyi]|uniref:LysM peptidoglycan-binding domain-containing protein n=1 Tax=Candidatus Venteria ishoeyi TaxID=1899563 RepID=UPI0025A4CE63|nr:LysM peptidoglycan-binding domain-containing protein [Candidatus Venteria ishoeyi]MDM8546256.1 LysM peptidoglycan-binding domain-containing protein [Candidatus Venteria ishoeyi]
MNTTAMLSTSYPLAKKTLKMLVLLTPIVATTACGRFQNIFEDPQPVAQVPGGTVVVPSVETGEGGMSSPVIAAPSMPASGRFHTVQAGDSLYKISHYYGIDYKNVALWNGISAPAYTIHPGQRLRLEPAAGLPAPVASAPVHSYPSAPPVSSTPPAARPVPPVAKPESSEPVRYEFDWDTGTIKPKKPAAVVASVPVRPIPVIAATPTRELAPIVIPENIPLVNMPVPVTAVANASQYHTVKRGDTLYAIANQYGLKTAELAALNGISKPYLLKINQSLLVSAPSVAPAIAMAPAEFQITPPAIPVASIPVTAQASVAPAGSATIYHTVQRGDTLYSIATHYQANYRDVAALNNLPKPYHLTVGQSLQINAAMPVNTTVTTKSVRPQIHTVAKGDTLSNIARQYNQKLQQLAALNQLKKPYMLQIGQALKITEPVPVKQSLMLASAAPIALVATTEKQDSLSGEVIYHTVNTGESLANIATQYQVGLNELALWNGIAPPYRIYPNQTVTIYR